MKVSHVIPIIIVVMIVTWCITSISNVQKAKNREGIILSPDKSKSLEFVNTMGTYQVLVNYHKHFMVTGSNVTSGDFQIDDLKLSWIGNDSILIEHVPGINFNSKETELYFFRNQVIVQYEELNMKQLDSQN